MYKQACKNYRVERDSFGEMKVPADKYYGIQTLRAIINFPIGDTFERIPVRNSNITNFNIFIFYIFDVINIDNFTVQANSCSGYNKKSCCRSE